MLLMRKVEASLNVTCTTYIFNFFLLLAEVVEKNSKTSISGIL